MFRTAIMGMLSVLFLVSCGAAPTSTTQNTAQQGCHFTITIPTGWAIVQKQQNPSSGFLCAMTIALTAYETSQQYSQMNIQVLSAGSTNVQQTIQALAHNSQFSTIQLHGYNSYISKQTYYVSPPTMQPGQTTLAPPTANAPGTETHTEYDIPTQQYLYTIITQNIVGQNADAGLNTLIQSFSVTS